MLMRRQKQRRRGLQSSAPNLPVNSTANSTATSAHYASANLAINTRQPILTQPHSYSTHCEAELLGILSHSAPALASLILISTSSDFIAGE